MEQNSYLEMKDISKSFYGVKVLDNVNLSIKKGEVHAIVGENGAGKSTLMKILAGIYKADTGKILLDGKEIQINSPKEGINYGISFVHQELSMVPAMSIAQNLFLGEEFTGKLFLKNREMIKEVEKVLKTFGLNVSPNTPVDTLSVAQQQMVEICCAISFNAKIIIMDEPTASLTNVEIDRLFEQIHRLKKMNVSIIFITHKLDELMPICDNLTVLRDGALVGSKPVAELTKREIISMMVGRKVGTMFPERSKNDTEVIFSAENLVNRKLHNISFNLKKGEILGISGLVGAGRTELAKAIYGIDQLNKGTLYLDSKKINNKNPKKAIKNGFVLVPEDRKLDGLVLIQSVRFNITLCIIDKIRRFLKIDKKFENTILEKYTKIMTIKMSGYDQLCNNLSGGNQQKVVFSKCLTTNPRIIILDEPTRGIDVGAKSEIYRIITDLAKEGMSVILISSELEEILNLSNRILIMHEGNLIKTMDSDDPEFTEEEIMYYATGGTGK